jgi:hypothetical protein
MNHHGSLTSIHDSNCRECPAFELRPPGSTSKDVLRSALEMKHNRASNPQLSRKNSVGMKLNLFCTFMIHISMSSLHEVHNRDVIPIFLHDLAPNLLKIFLMKSVTGDLHQKLLMNLILACTNPLQLLLYMKFKYNFVLSVYYMNNY